jgi:LysM repeat protein
MQITMEYVTSEPYYKSCRDYYPFGMEIPGRSYEAGDYRFGFNGQEGVNDISGNRNHYTALFWEYDSRVARRWNTDPVVKQWESPYSVFHMNPNYFTDPQGDDPPEKTKTHKIEQGQTLTGIAKQYGTSIENLVAWNPKISNPDLIYAGDDINVSNPSRWVGVSNGVWSDTDNPDERWTKQDGEWVDLNTQTFGEWYENINNEPVGYISPDGEITIGKYHSGADALMQITPPMIAWGAMVYANPRLPKPSSSSSNYQYLGSWRKGGNFGHFGSYNGQGFNFNSKHGYYDTHAASYSLSQTNLTVNQVEGAIARK